MQMPQPPPVFDRTNVVHGDCREVMRRFPVNAFDSIVTDPPYGLSFMGKAWDHGVPGVEFWQEVLRVAKPGAHLVAFGGTRTWHRLAVAIEDAGWEIRDTLAWMYGQGFPKSLDVSKAIESGGGPAAIRQMQLGEAYTPSGRGRINYDHGNGSAMGAGAVPWAPATEAARRWSGWGTALKPAFEPIILARKPLDGTVAANVLAYGVGGLNIDACRIAVSDQKGGPSYAGSSGRDLSNKKNDGVGFAVGAGNPQDGKGRWPTNVLLDEEAAALLDEQSGILRSGNVTKTYSATLETSVALGDKRRNLHPGKVFSDAGGASRFFYVSKASRSERTHGGKVENNHPTVKPLDLMHWLVRLITPPAGRVLGPFCGSGSTLVAGAQEGFVCVGIDEDIENVITARARLAAG